jgi:hypothetical protein
MSETQLSENQEAKEECKRTVKLHACLLFTKYHRGAQINIDYCAGV